MPTLKLLLWCQAAYGLLGLGYNVVSYLFTATGRRPLSATNPVTGALTMLAFGLFLLPGVFGAVTVYRVLMGLCVLIFGYGGVVKHVTGYLKSGPAGYGSGPAWALAVGINAFGLVLNVMAAAGFFRL